MKILVFVGGLLLGALVGRLLCNHTISAQRTKIRALRAGMEPPPKKRIETTKVIIWVCLLNGFAWTWFSYYLAYTDHVQIAESLSQVAVTEIIGVVLAYCIKSAVENLSKHNTWPDKSEPDEGEDESGVG